MLIQTIVIVQRLLHSDFKFSVYMQFSVSLTATMYELWCQHDIHTNSVKENCLQKI